MNPETAVSNESSVEDTLFNLFQQAELREHFEDQTKAEGVLKNIESMDIPPHSPPPKPEEIDQWQRHLKLQEFGEQLQTITNSYFSNGTISRYKNVYVLILKWEDEDPNLPVSYETSTLENVFRNTYHFQTEIWDIPDTDCHDKVNQKILNFKRKGDNSQNDLKIVYYGGHGELTRNGSLTWTRWRDTPQSDRSIVKWGGIQNVLEECRSDVLLLLDCCHSGTSNTNVGNGITELISACDYRTTANGVGPFSFTHALVAELLDSARKPHFSVLELYNNLYFRTQGLIPEDGRQRHPAPVHLVLTNNDRYWQSIRLSKQPAAWQRTLPTSDPVDTVDTSDNSTSVNDLPCLALAISLTDDVMKSDFPTKLFADWLQSMPALARRVRIEAGVGKFSPQLLQPAKSPFSRDQSSSSKIPKSISMFTPQSFKSLPSSKTSEIYSTTIASDPSVCTSPPSVTMDNPSVAATTRLFPHALDPKLMLPLYTAKRPKPCSYPPKALWEIKIRDDIIPLDLHESRYSTVGYYRKNDIFTIMTVVSLFLVPPWILIWLLSRSIAPGGASTLTVIGALLISISIISGLLSVSPRRKWHFIFLGVASGTSSVDDDHYPFE